MRFCFDWKNFRKKPLRGRDPGRNLNKILQDLVRSRKNLVGFLIRP